MSCTHDHKCEDHECSSDWSLYKHIDLPKVSALNESVSGSAKSVFKAWEQRLHSSEEHLESNEGDPELLFLYHKSLSSSSSSNYSVFFKNFYFFG